VVVVRYKSFRNPYDPQYGKFTGAGSKVAGTKRPGERLREVSFLPSRNSCHGLAREIRRRRHYGPWRPTPEPTITGPSGGKMHPIHGSPFEYRLCSHASKIVFHLQKTEDTKTRKKFRFPIRKNRSLFSVTRSRQRRPGGFRLQYYPPKVRTYPRRKPTLYTFRRRTPDFHHQRGGMRQVNAAGSFTSSGPGRGLMAESQSAKQGALNGHGP